MIPIILSIVLYEKVVVDKWTKEVIHTNPRFRKSIRIEITGENLKSIIAGSITVPVGTGFHLVSFAYRDWNKKDNTLNGKAVMREVTCRAYTKDLHRAGWKKIRQSSKTIRI
jgi:hypothetical protein